MLRFQLGKPQRPGRSGWLINAKGPLGQRTAQVYCPGKRPHPLNNLGKVTVKNISYRDAMELASQIPLKEILSEIGEWSETHYFEPTMDKIVRSYSIEVDGSHICLELPAKESGQEAFAARVTIDGTSHGLMRKLDIITALLFDGDLQSAISWIQRKASSHSSLLRKIGTELRTYWNKDSRAEEEYILIGELAGKKKLELLASEIAKRKLAEEKLDEQTPLPQPRQVSKWLEEPDDEVSYRIEGLWPSNGNVLLTAQHKAGKTTMAINLCKSLLDGTPFLGRFKVKKVTRKLVYLNFELSDRQFKSWFRRAGIKNTQNLIVWNLKGEMNPLGSELSREKFAVNLRELEAEVLLVDPFSGAFRNGDSNSNDEVKAFLLAIDELARLAGIKEVLLIAHAGHEGNRARGASTLGDHPDALWYISKSESSMRRLFKAEGRDVLLDEESLTLDKDGMTLYLSGLSRNEASLAETKEKIKKFIRGNTNCTATQIEVGLGGSKGRVAQARNELVASGEIIETLVGQTKRYKLA